MLVDLLTVWGHKANLLILVIFEYIFPEYPKIGVAVVTAAVLFFFYYLIRGKFMTALTMAASTLVTLSFVLYVIHWIIKLFHIAV